MKQTNVNQVRKAVADQIGRRVKIRTNRGRQKIEINEGVITESYPSIFVVKLDDDEHHRTLSFSYSDILTKDVQLLLCKS